MFEWGSAQQVYKVRFSVKQFLFDTNNVTFKKLFTENMVENIKHFNDHIDT